MIWYQKYDSGVRHECLCLNTWMSSLSQCGLGARCAMKLGARIGKLCDCSRGANCNSYLLKCIWSTDDGSQLDRASSPTSSSTKCPKLACLILLNSWYNVKVQAVVTWVLAWVLIILKYLLKHISVSWLINTFVSVSFCLLLQFCLLFVCC